MATTQHSTSTDSANREAVQRLIDAEPVLIDVAPAIEVVPGMTPDTILTSGAPMPWESYFGGQRAAVIGGALYEGLARDPEDADAKLGDGRIKVGACHDHGCVGSLAGIYTASMPVFVVENRSHGNRAFCNFFEGPSPKRLNYGVYDQEVRDSLQVVEKLIAPVIGAALRRSDGGIPLRPIIRSALNMGDELHSRNSAATLLFIKEMFLLLLDVAADRPEEVRKTYAFMSQGQYFFLRLSMAYSKATADSARDIEGSSMVSAMCFSCREFAVRVSGLGDRWFTAPIPLVDAKLFDGHSPDDIEYMGGESTINETVGLGGFAQAAAFPLQDYQGGSPEEMVAMNRAMYEITLAEHPELKIPYLSFRGIPLGIDVHKVVATGITPVMDIGVAGKGGGQIGAGVLRAPIGCFSAAAQAHREAY
ncbi:MAG: DUF1116 domain-containing protein [Actinomycetota bacterium]|nr:DUF1116 domain-containing protein [Actinomycetota bacterium]